MADAPDFKFKIGPHPCLTPSMRFLNIKMLIFVDANDH
jgi:hypothetical protein